MKTFTLPLDIITTAGTYVYRFFYLLFYFFFKYDIVSSAKEISFDNPFSGLTEYVRVSPFGGVLIRPIFNGIEKLFNIDLSITPFELLSSAAIILVLAYAIVKFLLPLF